MSRKTRTFKMKITRCSDEYCIKNSEYGWYCRQHFIPLTEKPVTVVAERDSHFGDGWRIPIMHEPVGPAWGYSKCGKGPFHRLDLHGFLVWKKRQRVLPRGCKVCYPNE